jgi:hypothetical protein
MKKFLRFGPRFLGLGVILLFMTIPSGATSLKVMNLEDLVGHSQRIFSAVCQSVSSGFDENDLPYTRYSFLVTDSIHGVANQQVVVIKQFGLSEPIQLGNGVTRVSRVEGMPRYVAGQEYLLFLNQANLLIDTRKSIQQRYRERQQNLSRSAPVTLPDELVRGPVSYDNLTSLVRRLLVGESLDRPAASRLLGRREGQ